MVNLFLKTDEEEEEEEWKEKLLFQQNNLYAADREKIKILSLNH